MTIIRGEEYKSPRQISSSSSSAALGRRLSAEERHEEWEKYNDNQAKKKKRTTRQQQQHRKEEEEEKNTLWELRNCRPGPRARHLGRAAREPGEKGATGGGDGGVFSLCAHIRQVITRRRPLRTSSIHNNNEQRKNKKKKRRKRHGIFIYNGESSSRGSRESFVPRKPKGEGYLIQSNGHRFNEYFFFSVKLWTLSEI